LAYILSYLRTRVKGMGDGYKKHEGNRCPAWRLGMR